MSEAVAKLFVRPQAESRGIVWERAVARRQKLERMFQDQAYLDTLLSQGRYFRLCAAFAWASANEERARADFETDAMVEQLRAVRSGVAK